MKFTDFSRREKEAIVLNEIILQAQKLGGTVSKRELKEQIKNGDNAIPEEFFDEKVISQKSGKAYRPSDFVFNFAMKILEITGYLTMPERSMIELTELGRKTIVEKNFGPTVQKQSAYYWKRKPHELKLDSESSHESIFDDEDHWRVKLLEQLKKMSPRKFEMFARALVKEMGVKLDETIGVPFSNDGGLDGFGYITSADDFRTTRVAIQAKRWDQSVSSPEIDKFRGAMDKFNAEYGIFITTSDFTRNAVEASRVGTRVITLLNGEAIADLVAKYQLHVTEVKSYVLDDFYFTED